MKKKLLRNNNFISRKGSATVMALMFLLFFVVAGASWAAMMSKEEETATGDKNAQQAWYAAEAGVKRAQVELLNKNTGEGWDWLSNSTTIPSGKFMELKSGVASTVDDVPRYGVAISYLNSSGTAVYLSTTQPMITSAGTSTAYTITSVGKYKDSTRTITKKFTITVTSS